MLNYDICKIINYNMRKNGQWDDMGGEVINHIILNSEYRFLIIMLF